MKINYGFMKIKGIYILIFFILGSNLYSQSVLPALSNFRIDGNNTSRVYFDVDGDISGLSPNGFIITGKNITGINTSSSYFTVNSPFTYWDNNTIRLEGGNGVIHDFTLQYIKNNIPEPSTSKVYYVSTSGNNGSSGTSENSAWATIDYAASQVTAGSTVYIKAGNYGSEQVRLKNNGTVNEPIKFIGYKNSPGDKPSLVRSQRTTFDSSEMPLIVTGSRSGSGITTNKSYIIVRNIQIDGYYKTVLLGSADYQVLDNIYVQNSGKECITSDFSYSSKNHRILNSYVKNASDNGIFLAGSMHLVDNVYSCSYGTPDMDYLIAFHGGTGKGGRNIIRNTNIVADPADTHSGHGLSIKSNGHTLEYCLIENVTIQDVGQAFEMRHHQVKYNVLRNCIGKGDREADSNFVTFRDEASYNIVENGYADKVKVGIYFNMNKGEDLGIQAGGHHNKIINTVFNDSKYHILTSGIGATPLESTNNEFINCTFYKGKALYSGSVNFGNSNKVINSIFKDVPTFSTNWSAGSANISITYSNFDNSFSYQKNSTNYNYTSDLKDPGNGNFKLKEASKLRNKGQELNEVKTDFDGNKRPDGNGIDLGAYEYYDASVSVIEADAGKDQEICLGETATLTASGGTSYLWSNGSTNATIKVSPKETTIYSVEVFEGGGKDSDDVLVSVNNVVADAGDDVTITKGEQAVLVANGGESYIWSNGETSSSITVKPNENTTYSVQVRQGNCSDIDEVQVIVKEPETPKIVANAGSDQTICSGDSVILTATGGKTFLWSNGSRTANITVSPNKTTTYSVEVTDGEAKDTDNVVVNVIKVSADAGADKNIKKGETISLTAEGGDEYLWSNGEKSATISVSPSQTKTYTVIVYKSNCSDSDEVTVNVEEVILESQSVEVSAGEDKTICSGESTILSAVGGDSYNWNTGDTNSEITVSPSQTTTYELKAKSSGIDYIDYVTIFVEDCQANIDEEGSKSEIIIYPNPSNGLLNLESADPNTELDIQLMNLEGKILIQDKLNSANEGFSRQLDLSSFTKGIYFVRIFNSIQSDVKKIVLI